MKELNKEIPSRLGGDLSFFFFVFLTSGMILVGANKLWFGDINNMPIDVLSGSISATSYGFNITAPISNLAIYTTDGKLRGYTNESGNMSFIEETEDILDIYGVDESGNYYKATAQSYMGGSVSVELVQSNNLVFGNIALGKEVRFANRNWRVVHVTDTTATIADLRGYKTATINNGKECSYYKDTSLAIEIQNINTDFDDVILNSINEVTVASITTRFFIPDHNCYNSYDYYNVNNVNRILYNSSGTAVTWLTAYVITSNNNHAYIGTEGAVWTGTTKLETLRNIRLHAEINL